MGDRWLASGPLAVPGQLPPPRHDPDEVRRAAEEVLDHPRYAEPTPSLLDRFWTWVADRLADLFSLLTQGGGGSALAWLVLGAAVAGLVLVLVRARRPMWAGGQRDEQAAEVMVELTRTPEGWRAEADRLRSEGRWSEAVVCRHRALVAELVGAGMIPESPGRTAREYLGDVARSRPAASEAFGEATELFEATWYGARPAAAADLDRMIDLEVRVLHLAGGRSEPAPQPVGAAAP